MIVFISKIVTSDRTGDIVISNIRLRNYGPFSDVEFDLERKKGEPHAVALVYGENGAGKTRLIDSIAFLKETAHTRIGSQSSKRTDLQTAVRERMMPGSDGMSATYGFLLGGKKFSYGMEFDGGGGLIAESLDGPISSRTGNIYSIGSSGKDLEIRFSPSFLKDEGFRKEMIEAIGRHWGNDTFLGIMNEQYILCDESFMERNILDSFDRFRRYVDSMTVFPSRDGCDLCRGIIDAADSK